MENAVHCQRNNLKLSRAKWKTCWCCFHWGRDLQHRESVQQVKKMLCGGKKFSCVKYGEKIAALLMLLKKDIIFEMRACVFWVRPRLTAERRRQRLRSRHWQGSWCTWRQQSALASIYFISPSLLGSRRLDVHIFTQQQRRFLGQLYTYTSLDRKKMQ